MKINNILLFIIAINLYACINKGFRPFINDFSKTIPIHVEPLDYFSTDSIGNPVDIFSFGRYIVLSEPQLDKLLLLYDLEKHISQRLQSKGRGPCELIGISQINSSNDSSFYVLDPFTQHTVVYRIDDSDIKANYNQFTTDIDNYFYTPSKEIFTQKGKFKYMIRTGNQRQQFGEAFPLPGHSSQIASYLNGISTVSFYQNRIAWFSCTGDIFEIYDFNTLDSCKLVKRQISLPPLFNEMTVESDEIPIYLPKTKLGVSSITSNDEHIFILYNENYIKDEINKKEEAYLSDKILVYDWEGNPIEILKLDKMVSAISYNRTDKHFYCLSHNEDAEIIIVKFTRTSIP